MATTVAAAIDQAANPKLVDESLWWDSFVDLFNDLENASLFVSSSSAGEYTLSSTLEKKVKNNHKWFLETVSLFQSPNQKSRSALDSTQVKLGPHSLIVKPDLKDLALQISRTVGLDEVQSYILVNQFVERNNVVEDIGAQNCLHLVVLHYYIERQCLLKCTRQIIMHALFVENGSRKTDFIREDMSKLISSGLDRKLSLILQNLLFSKHSEFMEVDLATLWAEETLIENNLVLDILFLAYRESLCSCNGEQWKNLCSLYKEISSRSFKFQGMAISIEARSYLYHSKVQLLLILVETLDLESLLGMVHDEVPFEQGPSVFTLTDIQEMDATISSFSAVDVEEAGPLILAWAVFICLISSLPNKQDPDVLMDIDHVGYVRQAFKDEPLNFILEILEFDILKNSDGPIAGYRSVLRTYISAFIASYEVTQQLDDGTLSLLLDIICKIYKGEESLCVQFWDRNSVLDGPIRSLLNSLEVEFPLRILELVRLLSATCEGTWPAECVYKFLDRSVGISSLFEVSGDIYAEEISQTVVTPHALHVPEAEELLIPSNTRGHVMKVIDRSTALVRWEYRQSGVFVLLLRLSRQFYLNKYEETHSILDLLFRLVSFNKAVCFALMDFDNSNSVQMARSNGHVEMSIRVDVAEIICTLVRNLSLTVSSVVVMSTSVNVLAKMLKCSPSHVSEVVLKNNIFDVASKRNHFNMHSSESGMWMLSSGLARMLAIDCEQTEDCCSLTLSVLDFTKQLVRTGAEDDVSVALVVFSLQYILVNHELWKYRVKHARWKVTLKVLELMKTCIKSIPFSQKMGGIIKDILLCDSSVHITLCRIMCITSQTLEKLHVSRLYEVEEIEGLQMAVCSVLDVVYTMLADFSKDALLPLPNFHQAMLSSTTKPAPVMTAMMSLISYIADPAIQVGAAKVLSMLCVIAEKTQPYLFGNASLISDDKQITDLRCTIYDILCEETLKDEDLLVATLKLLTAAARHQPAFLISVIAPTENIEDPSCNVDGIKHGQASLGISNFKKMSIANALLQYVKNSEDLIASNPKILLNVLIFLKSLWQGTAQYMQILELFKTSEMFWKPLSTILEVAARKNPHKLTRDDSLSLTYRYQCCSAVLEIIARNLFLEKKLLRAESPAVASGKSKDATPADAESLFLALSESSVLENLIKSYASCEYDSEILLRAMKASNVFLVHVMGKLITGDAGSLSLSFLGKIQDVSKKLSSQPAFSELLTQYSRRGYSGGKELNSLILNDLYYHSQAELEGREMNSAPFRELAQFMLQVKFHRAEHKYQRELFDRATEVYVFDLVSVQNDLQLEYWEHSMWKASKPMAEKMMSYMEDANLMAYLSTSKLNALKALTSILSVYSENSTETKTTPTGRGISETFISSCIECVCKCLLTTVESLVPAVCPVDVVEFLGAQAALLLCLIRLLCRRYSQKVNWKLALQVCTLVMKTVGTSLRVMGSIVQSMDGLDSTMNLFLLVLLLSVELCYPSSRIQEKQDKESVDGITEVSLLSLGLLPILCCCTEIGNCCDLSLATMDLLLNGFLTYSTWLPIIQEHLQLQLVIQKLRERDSFSSISIVLKFLLTLAQIRGGAEMLQTANFFLSLKALINILLDQSPAFDVQNERGLATSTTDDDGKRQQVWGLGLTVVTAMIYSLGDTSPCANLVDSVVPYFFSEKAYIIFHHLDLPDIKSEEHGKKRARTQKTQTSLTSLREIEHTLMLIRVLSKRRKSWLKGMNEMNSELRERSIHLLAFISKGSHRIGESPTLICLPKLKEEVELNRRPSFVNCKHGWFSLLNTEASTSSHTHFSDVVAVQMYRIGFLLLEFLCLQAMEAANRAVEMGFINLSHFPELPMPEILHGLQDQAIAVVGEICEINKSKQVESGNREVCLLLLQIMERSLYLEFCVAQSCGITPVLGRVEDFSKGLKRLTQVAEEQSFLKASLKSLRQIISYVYPGLLQTDGFL